MKINYTSGKIQKLMFSYGAWGMGHGAWGMDMQKNKY
jgi:hypothetical protein